MPRVDTATPDAPPAETSFPLQRRELLTIVAFWTFVGVLIAANRLFDPRGGRLQGTLELAPVAMIESYLWALLTLPIFWLGSRFTLEHADRRLQRVAMFLLVGLAVAALHAMVMDLVRDALLPPPPRPRMRPGGGGGRGGGGALFFLRFAFLNNLFIYSAILAAGVARQYSLRYRARHEESVRLQAETARLQAQLAEARLHALRMQLDPHFLFNTLNAISALVERDPRGVRRMIARLSELLRHTIEGTAEPEVTLEQELALLRRYLDIMQIRFQGRLDVATDVDPGVLDALVPNLVLQPLVENAIKHGVSRLADGAGSIAISARRAGDDVVLTVRDNGPGAESGASSGTGLTNTRARLAELYGAEQSRFTLRAAEGGGAIAEVVLPYHTRADVRTTVAADARG